MPRGKAKNSSASVRRTVEWKLARRATCNLRNGMPSGWASDALDCYLDGMSTADIALCMNCSSNAVGNAIAKEALYRLMQERQAERLEELPDLPKHSNKGA